MLSETQMKAFNEFYNARLRIWELPRKKSEPFCQLSWQFLAAE
jgi:hypothetical protein